MKIKIIKYDQTEMIFEVESFEFRTNHVSNWIKMKNLDGEQIVVHDVCVVKTINQTDI